MNDFSRNRLCVLVDYIRLRHVERKTESCRSDVASEKHRNRIRDFRQRLCFRSFKVKNSVVYHFSTIFYSHNPLEKISTGSGSRIYRCSRIILNLHSTGFIYYQGSPRLL